MADRKQFHSSIAVDPALKQALDAARNKVVSDEELMEQRISFAYGNAPNSDLITKDSVRHSSARVRIREE
jgi:hypothetical protein